MKKLLLLLVTLVFISCGGILGEEVGRLKINSVSTTNNIIIKEASVYLKKGDVIQFWNDMNIEYQDRLTLMYTIEIWKDGIRTGGAELSPFDKKITIGEIKTTVNNYTKWSFFGKMKHLTIKETGNYTFKANLQQFGDTEYLIKKAEIVLKK